MSCEYNHTRLVCTYFNSKAIFNLFHFVWPGENNAMTLVLHQITKDCSKGESWSSSKKIAVYFVKSKNLTVTQLV